MSQIELADSPLLRRLANSNPVPQGGPRWPYRFAAPFIVTLSLVLWLVVLKFGIYALATLIAG